MDMRLPAKPNDVGSGFRSKSNCQQKAGIFIRDLETMPCFQYPRSIRLADALNLGRNTPNGSPNLQTRAYDEQLVSRAALFKF